MNSAVITAVPEFGRSAGEQIRAALLALPPEGGTIDARAFSAPTGLLRERLAPEATVLALDELTPFDATGWVRIDNEVLQLAGRESEQLRIASRGCFGTAVAEHAAGAPVEAFHLLDRDLFAGVPTRPVRLLLGPATFHVGPADARSTDPADWALAVQHPSSGVSIEFDRTRLRAREALDSQGNSRGATRLPMLFSARTTGTLAAAARGDRQVVPRSLSEIDAGDLMIIFGHLPRGGRDTTQLTEAVTSSATALPVASAGMLPESGYVMVGDELIHYGGVDQSGATGRLIDCRRGYGGTPAAAHPAATTVDRCVYEKYTVAEVTSDGAVLLDRPLDSTFVARAAAIDVITGSRDITFGGVGELDGARGPEDTVYNGIAIFGRAVRRLQVGGGIYFHDWDHGGVMLGPALECQVDGWYKDIGWRTPQLGAAVWLFRNASRCVVAGQYGN
ncbi:MAG TPA: hypothetical protein VFL95_11790, partial [Gemmatimonadales bacterium]|nr:hypothetical protein [Gemmatimonadales bacterium]